MARRLLSNRSMPLTSKLSLTATVLVGASFALAPRVVVARGDPRTIQIVAKRFAFEPEVIEVERGESVRLVLRSADVTHGLEIDGYDLKVEIPRGGEPVSLEFVAERAGRFRVKCSEYCGSGHRRMRGELLVRGAGGGAR